MFTLKKAMEQFRAEKPVHIETGYAQLDKLLEGGITRGLYVIGGGSGIGKSAYALELTTRLLKTKPVLYATLEMPASELVARLVSKTAYARGIPTSITEAYRSEPEAILSGVEANRIFFMENDGKLGVNAIRQEMQTIEKTFGEAPIVIVDYFQILAPMENGIMTDKQKNDMNIIALKTISRQMNTTVIVLSSINRSSYGQNVEMQSMKETGSIEFTADCVIGMSVYGLTGDRLKDCKVIIGNNIRAATGKSIVVQLELLKNRSGAKGTCLFDYYPRYNTFTEHEEEQRKVIASGKR